ncbi:hypothetical protein VTO73DRAFT_7053 [Trametes versicolor]
MFGRRRGGIRAVETTRRDRLYHQSTKQFYEFPDTTEWIYTCACQTGKGGRSTEIMGVFTAGRRREVYGVLARMFAFVAAYMQRPRSPSSSARWWRGYA